MKNKGTHKHIYAIDMSKHVLARKFIPLPLTYVYAARTVGTVVYCKLIKCLLFKFLLYSVAFMA